MPFIALCANISWEFIFSFILPLPTPKLYFTLVWFSLDLVILSQFLIFGRNNLKEKFYKKHFYSIFLIALTINFMTILFISYETNDYMGKYTAFGQNLMMSILFITMLIHRNSTAGQSLAIGFFKLLGTLCAAILFYLYDYSTLILFFSISSFVFDFSYNILLYKYLKLNLVSKFIFLFPTK